MKHAVDAEIEAFLTTLTGMKRGPNPDRVLATFVLKGVPGE
jgi:hypothetical protein